MGMEVGHTSEGENISRAVWVRVWVCLYLGERKQADPSGRTFDGAGLRLLPCRDCGCESRRGDECLSVVSVVCCQVEVSATGRSLVQRSPTECGVSECDEV
jgi:hypothetical protein